MSILKQSQVVQRAKLAVLGVLFLAGTTLTVAYTALIPAERVTLAVGQVAPDDIRAPLSITYDSEVLTRLARQAAADSVGRVYDPPNPAVLRQQVQLARHVLDYIANIRADIYATPEQQVADLGAINVLELPRDVYASLLTVSDSEWRDVDAQVLLLLERTMRNEIREDNLTPVYASLPNLVSINMTETQVNLIVSLVSALIKPNAFYNEERTRAAKNAASLAVPAVTRSFAEGQIVVQGGSIVTEADMEALTQLRLLQPTDQRLRTLLSAVLVVTLISALIVTYMRRFHPEILEDSGRMILIGALFLLFLAGARLFNSRDLFLSHLYPAAAFTLIIVALLDQHLALALTAALAVLIGVITGNSLEFAVLVGAGGVAGVLTLRRVERLNAYFTAGLVIGAVNVAVGLLFGLMQGTVDPVRLLPVVPAGLLCGVLAAGLGLVGLYLSSNILNIPTSIKLLELSQPSQPLLQRLLREAPGTYQHSLQVANLAELAAERVGANAPLVRVGALYHDIGKLTAPPFFAENQVEGFTPHKYFSPEESARIIISHVTEGEKMGRRYRLPGALIDFILQHHGTTEALYFYNKALEAVDGDESKVDKMIFTYPGPRPQTREAAIMMLADTCESTVRSRRTRDRQEIADVVAEMIECRLKGGQLDDSGLTVNDLKVIREIFVSSLQGVFHPRIAYPAAPQRQTGEHKAVEPESKEAVAAAPSVTPVASPGEVRS